LVHSQWTEISPNWRCVLRYMIPILFACFLEDEGYQFRIICDGLVEIYRRERWWLFSVRRLLPRAVLSRRWLIFLFCAALVSGPECIVFQRKGEACVVCVENRIANDFSERSRSLSFVDRDVFLHSFSNPANTPIGSPTLLSK